jgi:hypothetical protein
MTEAPWKNYGGCLRRNSSSVISDGTPMRAGTMYTPTPRLA